MGYVAGLPTQPVIVFWSGDIALFLKGEPVWRGGQEYLRVWMILSDFTKARYRIKPEQLDYNISSIGVFKRDYPLEFIHVVPFNPEYQMYISLMNFDGTMSINTQIQALKRKIVTYKDEIVAAWRENEGLRKQLKESGERIAELRETMHGD